MKRYLYNGPVMEFERCATSQWSAETSAVSEQKARCNLTYQWKKENNRAVNTKVTLPGKLISVE